MRETVKLESAGMWHRLVRQIFTHVSEEHAASISLRLFFYHEGGSTLSGSEN
jgi:hypothetical protein